MDRGFLISQAIERWQARAIWVLSRADSEYPKRIKNRLKEDSPVVLYGCGQLGLVEAGGLAVIGSRHVDQTLVDYSEAVGRQCAAVKKNIVSGGAQGIDRAAVRGALEAGGRATAVLADSLERGALNRENRNWLIENQLVLLSPYDPSAGFNVGHAMQRNKVIYALADAALVVNAEYEKGGTWAGATEQLQKFRFVPVFVRSTGEIGSGLQALTRMGAIPWPNPQNPEELSSVFDLTHSALADRQPQLSFQSGLPDRPETSSPELQTTKCIATDTTNLDANSRHQPDSLLRSSPAMPNGPENKPSATEPAEILLACLREILGDLLKNPKTEREIASLLEISAPQIRLWLNRLVDEGTLEKRKRPTRFVIRQKALL